MTIEDSPTTGGDQDKGQILMGHLFRRLNTLHEIDIREHVGTSHQQEPVPNNSVYGDIDLYTAMDYVDTLSRKEKVSRDMLTAPLSSLLSQLSIVLECRKQIRLWRRSNTVLAFICRKCTRKGFHDYIRGVNWAHSALADRTPRYMHYLIILDIGKLAYPSDLVRTPQNVKTMRKSEKMLDDIWRLVDAMCFRETGNSRFEGTGKLSEGGRQDKANTTVGGISKSENSYGAGVLPTPYNPRCVLRVHWTARPFEFETES